MDEDFVPISFPHCGIDTSDAFYTQPNRPWGSPQRYSRTTPEGINVRAFEADSQRARGGSRPGLVRYLPVPVVADWIVQELALVVVASASAES